MENREAYAYEKWHAIQPTLLNTAKFYEVTLTNILGKLYNVKVVTDEFGNLVKSNDPAKGVATKGKYRFKVKWSQSPSLSETTRRAYFLVPNIKCS